MELHDDDRVTPQTMLRNRLLRLREAAGLSLRALGSAVNFPHTYISRVERGEQLPSDALAEALDRYFMTDGLFVELLQATHDSLIVNYSREFVAKEREALRIQVFTSSLIPGLLQTEDYARELFKISTPGASSAEIEARVVTRMNRPKRLFDRPDPPLFWAVMDEAALKRPAAGLQAMKAQIEHLLRMSDHPHISLQVLPFEQAMHPLLGGSLTLLTLRDGNTIALVESFASGVRVDSPTRIVDLAQKYDVARAMALPETESLDLIRSYL